MNTATNTATKRDPIVAASEIINTDNLFWLLQERNSDVIGAKFVNGRYIDETMAEHIASIFFYLGKAFSVEEGPNVYRKAGCRKAYRDAETSKEERIEKAKRNIEAAAKKIFYLNSYAKKNEGIEIINKKINKESLLEKYDLGWAFMYVAANKELFQ